MKTTGEVSEISQQTRRNKQTLFIFSLDIFPYFTTSCYKGFSDDDEGFYAVYRKVFEKLSAEDIEYMDNPEDYENIPKFGNSSTVFEDVINFYGHWESYSTRKSYAWLFTHNISELRDRRLLKLVDKEHKKIQQKARKERNEEIRSLVLFVKKRDKRMAEYRKVLEEKAQQNRLKSQQNRLDQIKRRSEQLKSEQSSSTVSKEHEDQLRELEKSYLNQYSDSDLEDDDSDEVKEMEEGLESCDIEESSLSDELYCVACNKFFNSDSAKVNHEGSKKHRQNVELLKAEMTKEEEKFQQKQEATVDTEEDPLGASEDVDDTEVEEPVKKAKGKKSKKKNKKLFSYDQDSDHEEAADEKLEDIQVPEVKLVESDDEKEDWSSNKKSKKSKVKVKNEKPVPVEIVPEPPKIEEIPEKPSKIETTSESDGTEHRCATCKQSFPSKNKLFTHLKKTNHSIYLGEAKTKTAEKSSSKKRK